jgi:CubicO group peptidase (beta-lactamase class C family)
MKKRTFLLACLSVIVGAITAPAQELPAVTKAIQASIDQHEIAGAVTLVVSGEKIVHLAATGQADVEANKPMAADAMFWIASMSKPITGAAIMMLQEEGKLAIDDPVGKYIPELGGLKTADGKPGNLTLRHLLTHTSGMAEATTEESLAAKTLADLMPAHVKPLKFEPGSKWQYCQSGINTLGRIIEAASGQALPDFLQQRFFGPLGMKDTTFYPSREQMERLAKPYKADGGKLLPGEYMAIYAPGREGRFPAANGGLFSTASDYARFAQMLMNGGSLDGRRYLSDKAVAQYHSILSGEVVTGFTPGNGWGAACCVVREPQGVSAVLSPGSFGHGGAYGTQVWIDPVKKRVYLLMVQRTNFPNSDASPVRRDFQAAAAGAREGK